MENITHVKARKLVNTTAVCDIISIYRQVKNLEMHCSIVVLLQTNVFLYFVIFLLLDSLIVRHCCRALFWNFTRIRHSKMPSLPKLEIRLAHDAYNASRMDELILAAGAMRTIPFVKVPDGYVCPTSFDSPVTPL